MKEENGLKILHTCYKILKGRNKKFQHGSARTPLKVYPRKVFTLKLNNFGILYNFFIPRGTEKSHGKLGQ